MYQLVPKKKKYIWLKIIGVLFACAFIKEILTMLFATAPVSQQLHDFANSLNKRCPIVVDSVTTLTNCAAVAGYRLHFNYAFNSHNKEEIDTIPVIVNYRETMINMINTDPNMAAFKKEGLSVSASFYDKAGKYICSAAVVRSDYKENAAAK